jgi:iron(III) transport system substrate-binding protein
MTSPLPPSASPWRRALRVPALAGLSAALVGAFGGCGDRGKGGGGTVVLYCSVDQDQAIPIVKRFEEETGVTVLHHSEPEAARSVGITQKLLFEKDHPVADVFWGNEAMNTVHLADLGVLAPLPAGAGDDLPAASRDPKGRYLAFAARARVLLVNRRLLPDEAAWPTSVEDLLDPRWGGEGARVAVARPLVGTTYTHAVAMLVADEAKGRAFWSAVAARAGKGEVKTVPGNGAVMSLVADSKNGVAWGLTDTDDARVAVERVEKGGDPVAVVYPDQAEGRPGTVVIPNTLALVRGGPHPEAGARLLRWLASREVEARLAASPIASIPVREDVVAPPHVKRPGKDFRAAPVDWAAVGAARQRFERFLTDLFAR